MPGNVADGFLQVLEEAFGWPSGEGPGSDETTWSWFRFPGSPVQSRRTLRDRTAYSCRRLDESACETP